MPIIREDDTPIPIPRQPLQDASLSFEALGLFCYIWARFHQEKNPEFDEVDGAPSEVVDELRSSGYINKEMQSGEVVYILTPESN